MLPALTLFLALLGTKDAVTRADRLLDAPALAARLDEMAEQVWQSADVKPSGLADDSTFLRRVTLDLIGRIPTYQEARSFADDRSPDKRARVSRQLLSSPEFTLHFGRVLDEMLQERFAGDTEFVDYLRAALAKHKPWDRIFREMMLGPWDVPDTKGADKFLTKRLNSLDDLTNDSTRAFFGVNVSCAKCHDHPLVSDWTQDHYYGMVSFFNPTYEGSKGKGRRGIVTEKAASDVSYVTTKGQRRTAKLMFLTSQVVTVPSAKDSRRERLVQVGLEEGTFFSRNIVNRLWAYFMGRGLVHPVDQIHSANPPIIPDLLEWLADDLVAHGYDLDRLIAGIVSSRVYQLASTRAGEGDEFGNIDFSRASLRALTPQQFALSALLATGDSALDEVQDIDARVRRYRDLEGQSSRLTKFDLLDRRTDRFQSSAGEALFTSNHPDVQQLVRASGNNLVARLVKTADLNSLIELAIWTTLSRAPEAEERAYLMRWLEGQRDERAKVCGELVWALITSAEFRFNH